MSLSAFKKKVKSQKFYNKINLESHVLFYHFNNISTKQWHFLKNSLHMSFEGACHLFLVQNRIALKTLHAKSTAARFNYDLVGGTYIKDPHILKTTTFPQPIEEVGHQNTVGRLLGAHLINSQYKGAFKQKETNTPAYKDVRSKTILNKPKKKGGLLINGEQPKVRKVFFSEGIKKIYGKEPRKIKYEVNPISVSHSPSLTPFFLGEAPNKKAATYIKELFPLPHIKREGRLQKIRSSILINEGTYLLEPSIGVCKEAFGILKAVPTLNKNISARSNLFKQALENPGFSFAGPTVVLVCKQKKQLVPIFSFLKKQSELLFLTCFTDEQFLDTLDLKKLAELGQLAAKDVFAQLLNRLQKGLLQGVYPEKLLNETAKVLDQSNVGLLTILKKLSSSY